MAENSELADVLLFLLCIAKAACMCGFVAFPFLLLGHKKFKSRKENAPDV